MKAYVCTLTSGAHYKDVNGKWRFAWKGRPITDADEKLMVQVQKDQKGNDVKVLKYGFEIFKGQVPGPDTSAAETAKELKRLAGENEKLKAEMDNIKAAKKD
jgi:hypothetical protein